MGQREKLYVLGHPVGHSKSPAMHNAAYRALGLDWEYGLMDCETEADAWAFISAREWRAINVTMPWKRLAIQATRRTSAAARLAHGANVLVNHQGDLFADNTDGKGCVSYLRRCGVSFEGASVVVCGTGPTSLAIMHACAQAGAKRITLAGRDALRCQQALEGYKEDVSADQGAGQGADAGSFFGDEGSAEAEFFTCTYDEGRSALACADVIVDATPLGMQQGDPAPFDTSVLSRGQVVFDVVYGHGQTALVSAAQNVGCATYDGSGMLVAQAVETVNDIAAVTHEFEVPAETDLFDIMAKAAGFSL